MSDVKAPATKSKIPLTEVPCPKKSKLIDLILLKSAGVKLT